MAKPKERLAKAGECVKEVGQQVKERAKAFSIKAIEHVNTEDVADLLIAATKKQDEVNAVLRAKGAGVEVGAVTLKLGPPPVVSMAVVRKVK